MKITKMTKAAAFIELFREMHPEFPPQTMLAFLFIAGNEGCTMVELAEALKVSPAAAGRNAILLCTKYNGKTGYGLVDIDVDLTDTRVRRLHLSPKGITFLKRLNQLME
jgi:DNA-binding MarR family transcriptional regulator